MNFQKMMQQAQQAQFKIQEMQERFGDIEVEGESGGGLVKVAMTCNGEVRKLEIDDSLMNADDKETVEDLIIAAINNANEAKDARIAEETKKVMSELGLPEGAQLPF